jgi:hypothetical protein
MSKWKGLSGPITAADAEAEAENDRLFGLSYEARQRQIKASSEPSGINRTAYRPWKKPRIERSQRKAVRS